MQIVSHGFGDLLIEHAVFRHYQLKISVSFRFSLPWVIYSVLLVTYIGTYFPRLTLLDIYTRQSVPSPWVGINPGYLVTVTEANWSWNIKHFHCYIQCTFHFAISICAYRPIRRRTLQLYISLNFCLFYSKSR